ncbi:MAG: amidohydrolase family protein [Chloroflexi bacterium]|nr:amidohydrolase family protein [Chloroflexota bacterium]
MQIVDPHHHLWDLEKHNYPWLKKPVDHFAGDYSAIRRTYLVADFLADARGVDLVKSVHLQAEFDHSDDPVKETEWLQAVHDDPASKGFPHACVGFADLLAPNVEDVLARHARFGLMRGIRYILNYSDQQPRLRFAPRGDLMSDRQWRSAYRLLARYGMSFDIQVWPWQLAEAARLAKDIPEVPMILDHTGLPIQRDRTGLAEWRRGMREMASAEHVTVKISGLGMFERGFTAESIKPFVLDTIDIFGVDRCMFASNFPVDKLASSYLHLWESYDSITRGFNAAERTGLFHNNAVKYYRL